jgi:hypothetical protein
VGNIARSYEEMERFVRTFETRWGRLIEWYKAEHNHDKQLEWTCFAALHEDVDKALEAAK